MQAALTFSQAFTGTCQFLLPAATSDIPRTPGHLCTLYPILQQCSTHLSTSKPTSSKVADWLLVRQMQQDFAFCLHTWSLLFLLGGGWGWVVNLILEKKRLKRL